MTLFSLPCATRILLSLAVLSVPTPALAGPYATSQQSSPSSISMRTIHQTESTTALPSHPQSQRHPQPHHSSNALISTALGSASFLNACPFAVHSNIVHGARGPSSPEDDTFIPPEEILSVLAPGEERTHPFVHDPGLGVSWKLWPSEGEGEGEGSGNGGGAVPVQFEWTLVPGERRSWWDLSMIDATAGQGGGPVKRSLVVGGKGNECRQSDADPTFEGVPHAFAPYGLSLQPHHDGDAVEREGMCSRVECPAGEGVCRQAYNAWNDWGQQRDCAEDVSLRVVLCG
jgi:hypothetical protein